MFCIDCGTELPDEANFCWKCGKPQRQDVQSDETDWEPEWETCEIIYSKVEDNFVLGPKLRFVAKATGPKGVYIAGKSPEFRGRYQRDLLVGIGVIKPDTSIPASLKDKGANEALANLINMLVKEGWESTGKGLVWYNNLFRRRIRT